MTRKLVNIKNILRIIISCFVLVNMVKSCAKAYTFDEFLEFAIIVKDLPEADANQKTAANWLINNESTIRTRLNSFNTSYNTIFNSWLIGRNTSNNDIGLIGYQDGEFNGWQSNALNIIKNATSNAGVQQTNGLYWNYGYGANKPLAFCLLKQEIADNVDFTGKIGNNYYSTFDMQFNHAFSSDYNYNGETIQAVQLNYNNSTCFIEEVVNVDGVTSAKAYLDENEIKLNDLRRLLYNIKISKIKRTQHEPSIHTKS